MHAQPNNDFLQAHEGQLAVDVIETRDVVIIRSAIAGVKIDDLDIHLSSDIVTIRGTRTQPSLSHDATIHFEECFWGTFSRSIVLPCQVRPDEADATFQDGVLTLTIPKTRGEIKVAIKELS